MSLIYTMRLIFGKIDLKFSGSNFRFQKLWLRFSGPKIRIQKFWSEFFAPKIRTNLEEFLSQNFWSRKCWSAFRLKFRKISKIWNWKTSKIINLTYIDIIVILIKKLKKFKFKNAPQFCRKNFKEFEFRKWLWKWYIYEYKKHVMGTSCFEVKMRLWNKEWKFWRWNMILLVKMKE